MNIVDKFMLSREVVIKEGEIKMDKQRVIILPIDFIGLYTLKFNNKQLAPKLYESMKSGMIDYSVPIGKEYGLSYRDYLDRWVKYCAFGGWGIVSYKLVETDGIPHGIVEIKGLPLHMYLKSKGITEASSDPLFDGLIAGSLSTTFKTNIDIIEAKCICAGDESCIYYWGNKEYLIKNFPRLAAKRFGDIK
ncbi:MAG: hypothetical protein KGH94_03200 [Candidatus Micrarchaeota archaeon]|nr:hypothetical protein [Candidatus Micrarchaeota archaeon]